MEAKTILCGSALEVLSKDNYISWSVRMKAYLMAQDLWDVIEVATESLKEEDDEAARRVRSKKNLMALYVILNSCGPEFFYEIRKISLANIAWYTLAEIYNNMPKNTNSVVQEVLNQDNYEHWSAQVKAYLMTHDLWDIVEATSEPPEQELDEYAFKTWSKKNFLALHVIQNSCGRHLFYRIQLDRLAKVAWDNLAKMCDVPKTTKSVVRDVLNKDNYDYWRVQIKTYLMAQDLWFDTIKATIQPSKQEDDEITFKTWTKKNLMALQVILNSCELDISYEMREITLAKAAWDALKEKFGKSIYFYKFKKLHKALSVGNWDAVDRYLHKDNNMAALNAKVFRSGETALHMAVAQGHVHIVEKLVTLMSKEDLEILDGSRTTAFARASDLGDIRMLECMRQKNENLLTIRDRTGRIPLLGALQAGNIEAARYLYSVTPKEDLIRDANDELDSSLISALILENNLDLALDLLVRCGSHTATLPDKNDRIPLYALACMPSTFPSGHRLVFWKKWIYACIPIHAKGLTEDESSEDHSTDEGDLTVDEREAQDHSTNEVLIVINTQNEDRGDQVRCLLQMSNQLLMKLLGIRHIYDLKVLHAQSRKLLRLTCKEIKSFGNLDHHQLKGISDIIFWATREGIVEIVSELLKANASIVRIRDEKSRTIFSFAVLCRQARIWNLLNGLPRKDQILFGPADGSGNTILHMAATVDTSTQLLHKTSAVFQMQRELQWFKEIEGIIPPTMTDDLNFENMRANEIFTRDHKEMLKEGEQWMKNTATSCTVVGTLIVTIMFAVAFAVPGGNNSETGLPMFSKNKLFSLFIISDALSLFSSTISVLMFLGILRSRYAEEDFLKSLPQNMIIGLFTLFFSIVTMMMAFCVALFMMLPGQSWMVIPIICLASLPVDLYVFMQFSLLVDMIKSTYGPSIFARK